MHTQRTTPDTMSTSLAAATRRPAVRLDVDRRLSSCSRASTSTTRPARSHTIITKVHPKGTAHQSSCDEATTAATPVKSRRDVLALAALLANTTPLAALAADDDDDLDDDAAQAAVEASMKDVLSKNSGEISYPRRAAFDGAFGVDGVKAASFEVSNLWDVAPVVQDVTGESGFPATARWGEIVDPVNGKVAVEARVFVTKGFPKQSIADLGKPENVPVAKALGLDKYDDSYRRADMLGSYKRVDKNDGDRVYYDWEMVASPPSKECPSAVGCLYPAHIYLMSATVVDGDLYVLSLDAFPENWRQTGNSLKRIRSSFTVSTPEIVVPVDPNEVMLGEVPVGAMS
jgi:hypothetical protein